MNCWEWPFSKNKGGYGTTKKRNGDILAHRISYELWRNSIPAGMQIDHICRNRGCVNPWHMEVVTLIENVMRGEGFAPRNARKTHCERGHEFTEDNIYQQPGTKWRSCRICHRKRNRDYYMKKKLLVSLV